VRFGVAVGDGVYIGVVEEGVGVGASVTVDERAMQLAIKKFGFFSYI
jgi:hypothetical protein